MGLSNWLKHTGQVSCSCNLSRAVEGVGTCSAITRKWNTCKRSLGELRSGKVGCVTLPLCHQSCEYYSKMASFMVMNLFKYRKHRDNSLHRYSLLYKIWTFSCNGQVCQDTNKQFLPLCSKAHLKKQTTTGFYRDFNLGKQHCLNSLLDKFRSQDFGQQSQEPPWLLHGNSPGDNTSKRERP